MLTYCSPKLRITRACSIHLPLRRGPEMSLIQAHTPFPVAHCSWGGMEPLFPWVVVGLHAPKNQWDGSGGFISPHLKGVVGCKRAGLYATQRRRAAGLKCAEGGFLWLRDSFGSLTL